MSRGRLNHIDLRWLRYPPTPQTWECLAKRRESDGVTVTTCSMLNSGKNRVCSCCTATGPRKLVWPFYVKIAVKAGLEAEQFGKPWWPEKDTRDQFFTPPRASKTRRKAG